MASVPAFSTESGTIAGVKFYEQPGSPVIEVGQSSGVVATRKMWIAWDDWKDNNWKFIQTLTDRPLKIAANADDKVFRSYPGQLLGGVSGIYGELVIDDISIAPAWGGRQKEIDVDVDKVGSYKWAEVTLRYVLEMTPLYDINFSMRVQKILNKASFTYQSGELEGDQASVSIDVPNEDITIRVRFSDLNSSGSFEPGIRTLSNVLNRIGKINNDRVTFRYPYGKIEFPEKTIKFESWELDTEPRFLSFDTVLVMRFNVAPAYLQAISTGTTGSVDWNSSYSDKDKGYIAVTPDPFKSDLKFMKYLIPTYEKSLS